MRNRPTAYFCGYCPAPLRCRHCYKLFKKINANTQRFFCGSCGKSVQQHQRSAYSRSPVLVTQSAVQPQQASGQLDTFQPVPLENLLLQLEGREIVLRQTWDMDDIVLVRQETETIKFILTSYTNKYHITPINQQKIQTLYYLLGNLARNLISRGHANTRRENQFKIKLDRLDSYTTYIKKLAAFESISTLDRLAYENMTVLENLTREAESSTVQIPSDVRSVFQVSLGRLLDVDVIIRQRQLKEDASKRHNWQGVIALTGQAIALATSLVGLGGLLKSV